MIENILDTSDKRLIELKFSLNLGQKIKEEVLLMGMMDTMSMKMIDGYEEGDIVGLMEDMHKTLIETVSEKWRQEILDSIKRSTTQG